MITDVITPVITKVITSVRSALEFLGLASFTPASLFTGGYQGAWYDPSDLSTMFQDTAGTVPITADGQAVARINDKSGNGNHATQATAASRPLYKTSAGKHWLEFDSVDDWLSTGSINFTASDKMSVFAGVLQNSSSPGSVYVQCGNIGSDNGSFDFGPFNTGVVLYRKASGSFGAREIAMTSSVTHVLTATLDLSGATHATENPDIRRDTTQPSFTNYGSADSGTGNFGNYPLYVGSRLGAGLYLNGKIYQLVVIGKTASGTEITDTETFINGKCGAY